MTAPDAAANIEAVTMLEESTELVERLWANAGDIRSALRQLGFDTGLSETPIVPVMLGEATTAQTFSRRLLRRGSLPWRSVTRLCRWARRGSV